MVTSGSLKSASGISSGLNNFGIFGSLRLGKTLTGSEVNFCVIHPFFELHKLCFKKMLLATLSEVLFAVLLEVTKSSII
ncbi:hypothetical protein LC593_25615 [Nostoc sp. CHAB 5844]|nr:hypothetical protein [Nostoc sp. CHAB 5844]